MKFLLSGEGPTDLGACTDSLGRCAGDGIRIGPMTVLLAQLAEPILGFDLLDYRDCLHFIGEAALAQQAKAKSKEKHPRLQPLRGKKKTAETRYFFNNAAALGALAKNLATESNDQVVAVLFRDTDGTRSAPRTLWQDKLTSMKFGFEEAGFDCGVPMLPKPKSEAWLIGLADLAMADCSTLEDLPGNDASPNSAKSKLDEVLGRHHSGEELCDWLKANPVDAAIATRLSTLPSFKAFCEALTLAIQQALQ